MDAMMKGGPSSALIYSLGLIAAISDLMVHLSNRIILCIINNLQILLDNMKYVMC